MADTEITLQIESEAHDALSDLDRVDSALERIDRAIGNIQSKLNSLSGMDRISDSMSRLADSIDRIDPTKFTKMASAVGKMASAANRAQSEVTGSFKNIEKEASNVEKEIDKMAQGFAKSYGIKDSKHIEEVTTALRKMADAYKEYRDLSKDASMDEKMNKSWNLNTAAKDVEHLIHSYGTYKKELDQTTQSVLDYVKAQNKAGSSVGLLDLNKEYGDSFAKMRATLGKAFKSGSGDKGFDSWLEDMNKALGTFNMFDSGNYLDGFKQLVDFIEEARQGTMSFAEALNKDKVSLSEVSDKAREFAKSAYELQKPVETDIAQGFKNAEGVIDEVTQKVQTIPQALEQASQGVTEEFESKISAVGQGVETATKEVENTISSTFERVKGEVVSTGESYEKLSRDIEGTAQSAKDLESAMESATQPTKLSDVLVDIAKSASEIDKMSATYRDGTAELQALINAYNQLDKAIKGVWTGKTDILGQGEELKKAQVLLEELESRIKAVKANLKEPNRLEINVTKPVNEIEKLYARLKELKSLIDDMKKNKINFTDADYTSAVKEYADIQKKIKAIEQPKGMDKSKNGALEFMATVVALQHEMEKVAGIMDKFGNIAMSAFKKALTPLKLFEHEFDHIKTTVSRIGSAFAMISKPITKVFDNMRSKWNQTLNAMEKRLSKLMRTFVYMGFRKAFTAIYRTMGEALQSLAKFSKSIGTEFNTSMSYLTSDLRYLGASIVAAFSPLINYVVPILDRFVDALVEAINKVNMFFAAMTGAKSFTIAKKKIVDYTDAMKKASKAAKQLTMGIDELNILNDKSGSDSDLDDLFDWQEIDSSAIPKSIQDAADKIKDIASKLWKPIAEAWDKVGDYVKDSFKRMLGSISGLLKDIGRDFLEVWNQPRTVHMLEQIFGILGDIFNIIANIADGWREAWNYAGTGKKILEDIRDLFDVIFTHIHNITSAMVEWTAQLNWIPLFTAIEYALSKVVVAVDKIGYVVEDVFDLFMKLGTYLIQDWAPRLITVFGDVVEGIGNIAEQIHNAWQELDFGTKVADGIDGIVQQIIPHLEELGQYFKEWASGLDFKPLMNAFIDLLTALQPLADFVSGTLVEAFEKLFLGEVKHLLEDVIPKITQGFNDFVNAVNFDQLRKNFSTLIEAAEHLQHAISEGVADAIGKLGQHLAKFINSKNFTDFIENLANFVNRIKPEMISKVLEGIGLAILYIADGLMKFVNSKPFQDFLDSLIRFMENVKAEDIADTLLKIAKAIIAFKGISAALKALSGLSSILPLLVSLAKIITPQGALIAGLIALAGAFVLFGDQIAAIDWKKLGKQLYEGVIGLIEKIDWKKVGENLGKVLGQLFALAFETLLNPAWQGRMIGIALKAIVSVISGLQQGMFSAVASAFEGAGLETIAGFIRGIAKGFEKIWDFISGLLQGFIDFCKKLLGVHSPSTVFAEIGMNVILGLLQGLSETWNKIEEFFSAAWETFKEWVVTTWQEITQSIKDAWNGLQEGIAAIWDAISQWFNDVWTTFKEWVATIWQGIVQGVVDAWNGIKEALIEKWNGIQAWFEESWGNFHTWATETWNNIKDSIAETWENLKTNAITKFGEIRDEIAEKWENIKSNTLKKWDEIKGELQSRWDKFKTDAGNFWTSVKTTLEGVWDSLKEKWSTTWANIKSAVEEKWNEIVAAKDRIFAGINAFFQSLWDGIESTWDSVWSAIKSTVSAWWENIRSDAQNGWDKAVSFVKAVWNDVESKWNSKWSSIHASMSKKWGEVKQTAIDTWNGAGEKIKGAWDGVKKAWSDIWNGIGETIKSVANTALKGIESMINGAISGLNWLIEKINLIPEIDIPLIPKVSIPRFATGGMPEDGLFYANHNELIGKFSNGQTVVANNQQITDGIKEAVVSGMLPILQEIATNTKITSEKDMSLSIDSREIARANNTGQNKLGKVLISTT